MNALFSQGRTALPRAGSRASLRNAKREEGFTLVELIAVMVIITILAAMVIGAVVFASKRAAVSATNGLIGRLSVAINEYHDDYGAYPPDGTPSGGWGGWYTNPGPNLNMPAETLYYFLAGIYEDPSLTATDRKRMARKSPYMTFREKEVRHTGIYFWMTAALQDQGDSSSSALYNGAIVDKDAYPEIVDSWGKPIQYQAKDGIGADPQVNKESFDLVSRGPDRLTASPYSDRDASAAGKTPNRDNITNFSY
jgi:prepilin-type N-terminal cleavage/methylation domain-containing protein